MLAVLLGRLGSGVAQVRTDTANELAKTSLEEVVVTAKRHLTDEQVTEQVEKALADDPYVYAEHVTVTTNNGVVRLEGIVGDTGERFRILRLCRKLPGARRVVDALELFNNDPDGG
jgi:osmotically-inducible protein OsmY